jgi:hypothetical protein
MTPEDRGYEEWLDGFSSPALTASELSQIRQRARDREDRELGAMVDEIELLRQLLEWAINSIDAIAKEEFTPERLRQAQSDVVRLLRFMAEARRK